MRDLELTLKRALQRAEGDSGWTLDEISALRRVIDINHRLPLDTYSGGAVIEEVEFCGCTNEELEAGRTCGQETCPNYKGVKA